jgi:hypothetical protein
MAFSLRAVGSTSRRPKSKDFLKQYPFFAAMLNKLWSLTWYAYIGASLLDPRFSIRYIGRYTKRAVMAEYRIVYYDGKIVRFSYKDYAQGAKTSYMTLKVYTFIGRLIRHIPDKHFPIYCRCFITTRIGIMFNPFKRIRCQCSFCNKTWRIPRYRILRFEEFFDIKKGQPFVWECHDCHEGVVIPGTYMSIHGETVKIDPKNLDPNTEVMRF